MGLLDFLKSDQDKFKEKQSQFQEVQSIVADADSIYNEMKQSTPWLITSDIDEAMQALRIEMDSTQKYMQQQEASFAKPGAPGRGLMDSFLPPKERMIEQIPGVGLVIGAGRELGEQIPAVKEAIKKSVLEPGSELLGAVYSRTAAFTNMIDNWSGKISEAIGVEQPAIYKELTAEYTRLAEEFSKQGIDPSDAMGEFQKYMYQGIGGFVFDLPVIMGMGLPVFGAAYGGSEVIDYNKELESAKVVLEEPEQYDDETLISALEVSKLDPKSVLWGTVVGGIHGLLLHGILKGAQMLPMPERALTGAGVFGVPTAVEEMSKKPEDRDYPRIVSEILIGAGLLIPGGRAMSRRQLRENLKSQLGKDFEPLVNKFKDLAEDRQLNAYAKQRGEVVARLQQTKEGQKFVTFMRPFETFEDARWRYVHEKINERGAEYEKKIAAEKGRKIAAEDAQTEAKAFMRRILGKRINQRFERQQMEQRMALEQEQEVADIEKRSAYEKIYFEQLGKEDARMQQLDDMNIELMRKESEFMSSMEEILKRYAEVEKKPSEGAPALIEGEPPPRISKTIEGEKPTKEVLEEQIIAESRAKEMKEIIDRAMSEKKRYEGAIPIIGEGDKVAEKIPGDKEVAAKAAPGVQRRRGKEPRGEDLQRIEEARRAEPAPQKTELVKEVIKIGEESRGKFGDESVTGRGYQLGVKARTDKKLAAKIEKGIAEVEAYIDGLRKRERTDANLDEEMKLGVYRQYYTEAKQAAESTEGFKVAVEKGEVDYETGKLIPEAERKAPEPAEKPIVEEPAIFKMGDRVEYKGEEWEIGFVNQIEWKGTVRLQESGEAGAKQINRIPVSELKKIDKAVKEPKKPARPGKEPENIRQLVKSMGKIKSADLTEHGISIKEDRNLFMQIGNKAGKPLDALAQTLIKSEVNPEGILPPTPSNMNPTDWLIENIRKNTKIREEKFTEKKMDQDFLDHQYKELDISMISKEKFAELLNKNKDPENISTDKLDKGDKFTIAGEEFKVTKETEDRMRIEDGEEYELDRQFDFITIDKGSLVKAGEKKLPEHLQKVVDKEKGIIDVTPEGYGPAEPKKLSFAAKELLKTMKEAKEDAHVYTADTLKEDKLIPYNQLEEAGLIERVGYDKKTGFQNYKLVGPAAKKPGERALVHEYIKSEKTEGEGAWESSALSNYAHRFIGYLERKLKVQPWVDPLKYLTPNDSPYAKLTGGGKGELYRDLEKLVDKGLVDKMYTQGQKNVYGLKGDEPTDHLKPGLLTVEQAEKAFGEPAKKKPEVKTQQETYEEEFREKKAAEGVKVDKVSEQAQVSFDQQQEISFMRDELKNETKLPNVDKYTDDTVERAWTYYVGRFKDGDELANKMFVKHPNILREMPKIFKKSSLETAEQEFIEEKARQGEIVTEPGEQAQRKARAKRVEEGEEDLFTTAEKKKQSDLFEAPSAMVTKYDMPILSKLKKDFGPKNLEDPIRVRDIGKKLAEDINYEVGQDVRMGFIKKWSRKAKGLFFPDTGIIRINNINDLGTFSHEIGHLLDKHIFGIEQRLKPDPEFKHITMAFGIKDAKRRENRLNKFRDRYGPDLVDSLQERYELRQEMKRLLQALQYPTKKMDEAIAEFVHQYVIFPEVVEKTTPKFLELFEGIMDTQPQFRKALLRARDKFKEYREQDPRAIVESTIHRDSEENRLLTGIKNTKDGFFMNVIDGTQPFRQLSNELRKRNPSITGDKDPLLQVLSLIGIEGKATQFFHHHPFLRIGKEIKILKNIRPLFGTRKNPGIIYEIIENNILNEFEGYAIAKRNLELIKRGMDEAATTTKEISELAIKGHEKTYGKEKLEKLRQELWDYQASVLQYYYESGKMSKENYKKALELNEFYVPFKRFFDVYEGGSSSKYRLSQYIKDYSPKAVHAIKGSHREVVSPIGSIIKNTYDLITAADRNTTLGVIVESLQAVDRRLVQEIPAKQFRPVRVLPKPPEPFVDAEGNQWMSLEEPSKELENRMAVEYKKPRNAEVITVIKEGIPRYYQIPKRYYDSYFAMQEPLSKAIRLLSMPARVLRAGAVVFDPTFAVRNVVRDQVSAWFYTRYGYAPWDFFKGIMSAINKTENYQKFLASGADQSFLTAIDKEMSRGYIEKRAGKKIQTKWQEYKRNPLLFAQDMNRASELGTRVGAFNNSYKKTGDVYLAMQEGREISGDYGVKGQAMKSIAPLYTFLNARIQHAKLIPQSLIRRRPAKFIARALPVVAISMANWYWNHRDDQVREAYSELPVWRRIGMWNVHIPGTDSFIPLPRGPLGILFGATAEKFLDHLEQEDPLTIMELGSEFAEDYMPIYLGPDMPRLATEITPQFGRAIVEQAMNKIGYTGRPIIPERYRKLKPEDQHDIYTNEIIKQLGQATGLSPMRIQHLITAFTAGAGRGALSITDEVLEIAGITEKTPDDLFTRLSRLPITRAFVTEAAIGTRGRSVQNFYKKLDHMESLNATKNLYVKDDNLIRMQQLLSGKEGEDLKWYLDNQKGIGRFRNVLRVARFLKTEIAQMRSIDNRTEMIRTIDKAITNIAIRFNNAYAEGEPFPISKIMNEIYSFGVRSKREEAGIRRQFSGEIKSSAQLRDAMNKLNLYKLRERTGTLKQVDYYRMKSLENKLKRFNRQQTKE